MRAGAYSVQQALTQEAASVLKLALSLAKRRGHAQVTPLHVAATLLSSTTSPSFPNLLRRACLKSHPHHPASRPLQCRALELCFNVALNRLPTTPPPSSGPLTNHHHPSLSNALIAALKRAQAHQRRGSIELQHQLQQQQQPLLAIKVELEQLIISILDDPSVSRVMREAGFSSTCVKNNLEEDSSTASASSSPAFFFESHRGIINQGTFCQTHFLKPSSKQNPLAQSSQKEDLNVVLEVMLRKQGRRSNTVVVGDSVSSTEGLVVELMNRVERGEVPDELRTAQFIKLHLSSLHLRLMSRGDVDKKVSDLRTKIRSLTLERGGMVSIIIYAGDLRWAVDEDTRNGEFSGVCRNGFKPVEHLISEVGRLLSELRNPTSTKVWLMATASYQTYMRCQVRHPSLETQWALQAVAVPSGGLALSLQVPSDMDSRLTKLTQFPFQALEPKAFDPKEEEENLLCCAECTSNYEKEASMLKSSSLLRSSQSLSSTESKDVSNGSTHLPPWLQPHRPDNHHKDALLELKRKWSRLCQRLHHGEHNQIHLYPPVFSQSLVSKNYSSPNPWWSASSPYNQDKTVLEPHSISFPEASPKVNWRERDASKHWLSKVSLHSPKKHAKQEVRATLALGSPLFSGSTASTEQGEELTVNPRELYEQLEKNIPWQSEMIPSVTEALFDCRSNTKGTWLLIQGTDHIAKRRLARVMAESICGSMDRLIHISTRKLAGKAAAEILVEALTKDPKAVVFIEFIDQADAYFTRMLASSLKNGFLEDQIGTRIGLCQAMFILTSTSSANIQDSNEKVVNLRLSVDEMPSSLKRNLEWDSPENDLKKPRIRESDLDLNICAEEDDMPSDLTQEIDSGDNNLPANFLESIETRFTLDSNPDRCGRMAEGFSSKLHRAFEDAQSSDEVAGSLIVDRTVVEELMEASGSFMEKLFEEWLTEVFQMSLATVKKGRKVRLSVEGKEANVAEFGFHGSSLPSTILVD